MKGCSQELHLPSNSPQIQTCALEKKRKKEGGKKKSYLQRHNGSKEPKVPSKNHVTVEKCLSHDEHENWFIYLFYSFPLFLPKSVYRDANETWSIKACRQC